MTVAAQLQVLAARGAEASPPPSRFAPLPPERIVPVDLAFPRCPKVPDDHQGYRPAGKPRGIGCSYCNAIYVSDGNGGWVPTGERPNDPRTSPTTEDEGE